MKYRKIKAWNRTTSVHENVLNLNNSTLERKSHANQVENLQKKSVGIKFCGSQKIALSQVSICMVDCISAREDLYF